ncbi:MAG: four helix bundle protein [Patescibacteria group bacterium]
MEANNYNLEERTAKFGEEIIKFLKCLEKNIINIPLINQLIRSSTSIGANYCEANNASSRRDFKNKIFICKKESQETKYWLRIIATANPEIKEKARELWKEVHELNLIFQKIISSVSKQ